MGMFDEVWFDERLPDFPLECRRFQTKSLDNCMDRYIVSEGGRLIYVGSTLMEEAPDSIEESKTSVDRDFHGDLRLTADEPDYERYIARFTHGTFEWIRPSADVPEFRYPIPDDPQ